MDVFLRYRYEVMDRASAVSIEIVTIFGCGDELIWSLSRVSGVLRGYRISLLV